MVSRSPAQGSIGSDFESLDDDDLSRDSTPPWAASGRPTVYLETGRQALALIAEALSSRGRNRLLVPGLLCESMIEPFVERGWTIVSLGLRPDLGLPAGALRQVAEDPWSSVVLLAAYFGQAPDGMHRELASEARAQGVIVIEDETHRVFRPSSDVADFTVASLRKLLPVGDGAYLQGDDDVLHLARALSTSDSLRWAAMDAKRESRDSGGNDGFRLGFVEENLRLETPGRRLLATERSVAALRSLPYAEMAAIRTENATYLGERVPPQHLPFAFSEGDVPSHLVLSVADPRELQARLAARGIFCAIHWPRVEGVIGLDNWRADLISVPVDHRYDLGHMTRVADAIAEELPR